MQSESLVLIRKLWLKYLTGFIAMSLVSLKSILSLGNRYWWESFSHIHPVKTRDVYLL